MADDTKSPVEEEVVDQPQEEVLESEAPEQEEPKEETPEEPEQSDEEPEAEAEETPEEAPEEEPQLSHRAQKRAEELEAKRKAGQERFQEILNRRTSAPSQPQFQRNDALDYQRALDADPEVIQQLEADRQREAQTQYMRGLEEAKAIEFRTNVRLDLPLVEEKLKKLDPADAQALDIEYLKFVGFDPQTGYVQNPNIGYAEFVDARIEQAERLASSMNAQSVKNIAKQSAQTGLRPDGSSAKRLNLNQAPENMTDEELYAVLGQKPPKK